MPLHAFVDESFADDYLLAAAVVAADDVTATRAAVRRLLKPGQARIHFQKESDARRAQVLTGLEALGLTGRVYVSENGRAARRACLERLVPDLATLGVTRLVLERDDSLIEADRRALFELTGKHAGDMEYQHLRAGEDVLLCLADAVAWCYAKGGQWRPGYRPTAPRSGPRRREAPLTDRPDGCGAHFLRLLPWHSPVYPRALTLPSRRRRPARARCTGRAPASAVVVSPRRRRSRGRGCR